MTTYLVTADLEISTAVFNPPPGWVLAEFIAEEPSQPFNPLTVFTDGRVQEVQRLDAEAEGKAIAYVNSLKASGVQPRSLQEFIVDEYPTHNAIDGTEYPTRFSGLDDFVDALNTYEGENIWQDLIWGCEIEGDELDSDHCEQGTGDVIYLKSGGTIIYHEHSKEWC